MTTPPSPQLVARFRKIESAIKAIYDAVEASAAPMNVAFALKEMAHMGHTVTIDPLLLVDLFDAHSASSGKAQYPE